MAFDALHHHPDYEILLKQAITFIRDDLMSLL